MSRRAASTTRRERVLNAVQSADGPVAVADLAEVLAVHPNTVRFHLDALEKSGQVTRTDAAPHGRGRPRQLYSATADARTGARRYDVLAGILADGLDRSEHGRERAAEAGFAWGRTRAACTPARSDGAAGDLVDLLDEIGFAPRGTSRHEARGTESEPTAPARGPERTASDGRTLDLHNCPFLETVTEHAQLICGVHAGLIRGALAGWGSSLTLSELEPFAAPGVCRVHMSADGAA